MQCKPCLAGYQISEYLHGFLKGSTRLWGRYLPLDSNWVTYLVLWTSRPLSAFILSNKRRSGLVHKTTCCLLPEGLSVRRFKSRRSCNSSFLSSSYVSFRWPAISSSSHPRTRRLLGFCLKPCARWSIEWFGLAQLPIARVALSKTLARPSSEFRAGAYLGLGGVCAPTLHEIPLSALYNLWQDYDDYLLNRWYKHEGLYHIDYRGCVGTNNVWL